jgi:hypothetical protein
MQNYGQNDGHIWKGVSEIESTDDQSKLYSDPNKFCCSISI